VAVGGAEIHAVEGMWFHDGLLEGWVHLCFQFICKLGEIKQARATSFAKNDDAIQTILVSSCLLFQNRMISAAAGITHYKKKLTEQQMQAISCAFQDSLFKRLR